MIRRILTALLLLSASLVSAQTTLTLTATHLTMEQGQVVPPLIWSWSNAAAAASCTGEPSLTTTATSTSGTGTYPITISAGTLSCTGYSLAFAGSPLDVLPSDGKGATLIASVTYPPGLLTGPTGTTLPQAIDVTNNATCDLDPTGVTDGTSCLNTLLARFMHTNCSTQPNWVSWLYFPPGTYTLAGPVLPCGNGWHLLGSGVGRTIIRVPPNTSTYNSASDAPWLSISSVGGNSNFREAIENLTIDVGYGNPKMQLLVLAMNNVGRIRNVVLYSEDSTVDEMVFFHSYPGPALFKDVAIYGGNYALYSGQVEYSWTFDRFTTEGQLKTVLSPGSTKMNLEHWLSDNQVTALSIANNGQAAILDSSLLNGASANPAIKNVATSSVYARNVTITGYGTSDADSGSGTLINYVGNLIEKWTNDIASLFSPVSSAHSLQLPDPETPEPNDPDPSTWTMLDTSINTWGTQIANATSSTVYAPPGQYTGTTGTVNITVPDTVNHLQFYGSLDTSQQPKLYITVAGSSSTPLVIDGCVYDACTLIHTGPRVVVLRDTYLNTYQPSAGAGNVFFEDDSIYSGSITNYWTVFPAGQSVWGRQFNAESRTGPEIQCSGCNLWILGLKTENSPDLDPVLELSNGAQAEVFGAFIYPLASSTIANSPYSVTNSKLWIAPTFEFVNVAGYGWPDWVEETQGSTTQQLSVPGQGPGDYVLNGYYSNGSSSGGIVLRGTLIMRAQ